MSGVRGVRAGGGSWRTLQHDDATDPAVAQAERNDDGVEHLLERVTGHGERDPSLAETRGLQADVDVEASREIGDDGRQWRIDEGDAAGEPVEIGGGVDATLDFDATARIEPAELRGA